MELNERFRKYPIKFYKTENGVYYENPFMRGEAKDLNDAFSQIKNKELDKDLFYYYDDVQDIQIGAFEPALKDRKTRKGIYLGKLNLDLEITDFNGEHTIKYISNNDDRIEDHEKFIKKLKDKDKRDKFLNDLKAGLKKVAGYFSQVTEMFSPYKTRKDLICNHCGDIIPVGSYYEEWHKEPYHLECIWDRLSNDTKSNEHENCIEYFLSLQELKPWPGDFNCQDDYISDLELFKANQRNIKY